ncbi:MAG: IclR family transcriptional regulator [Anaerolineaceae bacterium]|nr:IclR family transcriptional regulator [Anaerolineaceae bacterium]
MTKIAYDQQPNQALAKALEILNAFSEDKPTWGIRELGRELGINPTTIHRLVTTLVNAGYLERSPERQTYSLGPRVLKLADVYHHFNPLPTVARKVFETYADRFEHTLYLGCLNNYEVIYLAIQDGRAPIKVTIEPGASTGLHSTALGKILLANQTDEFISDFINSHRLSTFTQRTITNPETLWDQIREIRECKYAVNDGEQYPDVGSLGVPVPENAHQSLYAVSLAYPRHLITENRLTIESLVPLAREIARDIAIRINGIG